MNRFWRNAPAIARPIQKEDDLAAQLSANRAGEQRLTMRRRCQPRVLQGAAGPAGDNRYNGKLLPGKIVLNVREGEQLTVATPGGGGWGRTAE